MSIEWKELYCKLKLQELNSKTKKIKGHLRHVHQAHPTRCRNQYKHAKFSVAGLHKVVNI